MCVAYTTEGETSGRVSVLISPLEIFCSVLKWNNFENWSIFCGATIELCVSVFEE